jgi:hypothetical protein
MGTAKPRTLTSSGFLAQLTSLKNAGTDFQKMLKEGAESIRKVAVENTPEFDPEMRAGWQLVETGAIGSDRYTVSVVNTSQRATTPLAFDGITYLSPEGKAYTLLDVYDKGTRKKYTIAPRNKGALAFFWVKQNRWWYPVEGQTVTHPGLLAYGTISKTQDFAAKVAAQIRAAFRGNLRATLSGRRRRFNRA